LAKLTHFASRRLREAPLTDLPSPPQSSATPLPSRPALAGTPDTAALKQVPETRALRERIRAQTIQTVARLDKSKPLARHEIETHGRAVLAELGLPEAYLGWTMVTLASAFWREEVMGIRPERRLLLLPRCLRNEGKCPAECNEIGLLCQDCGACSLSGLRAMAEKQGYRVLIAEGTPIVLQIILAGQADALLGVGCLRTLERALDKILLAGLPCMAVPLHCDTCCNTTTDEDWVREMIDTPYRPGSVLEQTRVHLLRGSAGLFEREALDRLAPQQRGGTRLSEANGQRLAALAPLATTEAVAYDFLAQGGKRLRPFITLAAYDALTGGRGAGPSGAEHVAQIPDAVKRIALAMEVFHKASLVHDDIEDDDPFRYGQPTLHRKYGVPLAINVGDYLIGLGYRLVASQRAALAADVVADILVRLSEAHTKLAEGQGAELAWRSARRQRLAPVEALRIYALKTAPAFEAALYAGVRLAGPAEPYGDVIAKFSRHLGVAYQILNDLDDWSDDPPNKQTPGTDVLGGRPTVLLALALENLPADARGELETLLATPSDPSATLDSVRRLYHEAAVFEKAAQLVTKHRARARQTADQIPDLNLRDLLHYFVDTTLK
jgi:geranylgeranyl pyrophosphate synthase